MLCVCLYVLFFKQKTAYEMRISDWSSDVCSSDLGEPDPAGLAACAQRANDLMALSRERIADEMLKLLTAPDPAPTVKLMLAHRILEPVLPETEEIGRASCRARVCPYVSISVVAVYLKKKNSGPVRYKLTLY